MNKNDLRFLQKDKKNWTKKDIELLESGYPLAYIIGYVDFLNSRINLNHKVLIPRAETEYWVSKVLPEIKNLKSGRILDIFSGSGCIGISLLYENPNIHVTFSDIDENAILQTLENLGINKINKSRYEVIQSNLFGNISSKFDYIFANPPYVGINEEVGGEIKHEPKHAIYSEDDGMYLIEKFLNEAKNYLNSNGTIYLEFGSGQKRKIAEILKSTYSADFSCDQYGKDRFAKISQKAF